ncbi:hypothetical protein RI129_011154 [Pyrocoelia pectoralis]|uniref:Uncharacterized protein n=1 Tax=Pyrocoelia pectoralis TaxID=417401 RepID=A0AAN7ZIJ0_9COLE
MVYGQGLRLPGEFLSNEQREQQLDAETYVTRLRKHIQDMRPTPASNHDSKKHAFKLKNMDTATHVYVRVDAAKRPLQAPYEGPYRVVKRNEKLITIDKQGAEMTISCDRVKPAFQGTNETISQNQPDAPEQTTNKPVPNDRMGNDTRKEVTQAKNNLEKIPTQTRSGRISKPKVRFQIE